MGSFISYSYNGVTCPHAKGQRCYTWYHTTQSTTPRKHSALHATLPALLQDLNGFTLRVSLYCTVLGKIYGLHCTARPGVIRGDPNPAVHPSEVNGFDIRTGSEWNFPRVTLKMRAVTWLFSIKICRTALSNTSRATSTAPLV